MNPCVLYVDDEEANLEVFELSIRDRWPVLICSSGQAALERMRAPETEVAVLLTDQRMPGMTGTGLLEQVRMEFPDTVRMLVTAYSDLNAAVDAINLGQAQRYLKKPWDAEELRLVIGEAFDAWQTQRRLSELERRLLATERVYALGLVSAGLAHELRNPLSAISSGLEYLHSISGQLAGALGPELREDLPRLLDDMELALGAMIDITASLDLSTRSKPDGEVDLREVASLAARAVRGTARRCGAIELVLAPVPLVQGSRTRLGQVVLNLLVNGLEAFDPAMAARNRMRVLLEPAGNKVRLVVEDNGPGMSSEVRARIFDPFFTTKTDGGTGLGLAISKQIVAEHGGTLEVKSTPGVGTSFVLELPTP